MVINILPKILPWILILFRCPTSFYNRRKKYDEKNNIFNPIDTDEINDAQEDLKEKMIQNAKDKGILDMAKDNAEKTLTSLLGGLDDSYTIEVQWKD